MKKVTAIVLALLMVLSLAACGAGGGDGTADDVSDAPKLHLEMSKNVYEDEYRADDGTLLYSEYYELPQLELQDEEGKVYAQNDNTALGAEKTKLRKLQLTFKPQFKILIIAAAAPRQLRKRINPRKDMPLKRQPVGNMLAPKAGLKPGQPAVRIRLSAEVRLHAVYLSQRRHAVRIVKVQLKHV